MTEERKCRKGKRGVLMKGKITTENLKWFEPLLTKEAVRLIKQEAPVYAIGVAEDRTETACGAIAGYVQGGVFQVISLFVSPGYRLQGYGNMLLGDLVEICRENGMGINVSFSGSDGETEALQSFLEYWFFHREEISEGQIYEIALKEALHSEHYRRMETPNVRRLSDCSEYQIRRLSGRAYEEEMPVPENGFFSPDLEKNISVVYLQDQEPTAYLLFDHSLGGRLTLCALASFEKSPVAMAQMLDAAMRLCSENYSCDTLFFMQAVNETSEKLIKKVFPGARAISHTYYLPSR